MVVRRKKGTCAGFLVFMNMLHDSPCNGNTVVGGSSSSQFIKKHQASRRNVVEDIGCLVHFDHKRRFSYRNVVAGTYTGKNFIYKADVRTFGRDKASNLRHQGDEGSLSEQSRLTGHVRSGDNDDLLLFRVEIHIVGDVLFSRWQLFLNHRMTSLTNVKHIIVHYIRTDVFIGTSHVGK